MYRARVRNAAVNATGGAFDWFFSPDGTNWVPAMTAPTHEDWGELWTTFDSSLATLDRADLVRELAVFESMTLAD